VVEYASITAALTIFVTSLTGVYASGLTSSSAKTANLVASIGRAHHVPAPKARAAYAAAPYGKPALRYLYAVGWVGAASNLGTCKGTQLLGPDPTSAAAQALQASPKALALLHSAHITVSQAAAAIGRGSTDGCS
jgi:hypothetical protein